jgi:cation transport ATPase
MVRNISNAESNHEKEQEERLKSANREDFKKKRMKTRKNAGLIISGIGAVLYLVGGFFCLSMPFYFGQFIAPYLITGVIVIIGAVIGLKKNKLGGALVLIAIPIAIIIGLIYTLIVSSYFELIWFIMYMFIQVQPIPYFPSAAFIIIGGILCVLSTD